MQRGGDVALAVGVPTPGADRSVRVQCHALVVAGRHRDNIMIGIDRRGDRRLTVLIVAPRRHRAVVQQRHRVILPRRNLRHASQCRRSIYTAVTGSPGHDRAVALQSHRKVPAAHHRGKVGGCRRIAHLTVRVGAPAHDLPVGPQGRIVRIARRHGNKVRLSRRRWTPARTSQTPTDLPARSRMPGWRSKRRIPQSRKCKIYACFFSSKPP